MPAVNGTVWKEECHTWLEKSVQAHIDTQRQRLAALEDAVHYLQSLIGPVVRDIESCEETLAIMKEY